MIYSQFLFLLQEFQITKNILKLKNLWFKYKNCPNEFTCLKKGEKRIEFKYNNLFNVLQPQNFTHDSYSNLTNKVFRTFIDIYKNKAEYDWYLKCDSDTFIFMDNLQEFLKSKDENLPVTYGYDFKLTIQNGFRFFFVYYFLIEFLSNI